MLGTLVLGQKNNQSSQLASKAIQKDLGTNSVSETVPRRLSLGLLIKPMAGLLPMVLTRSLLDSIGVRRWDCFLGRDTKYRHRRWYSKCHTGIISAHQ